MGGGLVFFGWEKAVWRRHDVLVANGEGAKEFEEGNEDEEAGGSEEWFE